MRWRRAAVAGALTLAACAAPLRSIPPFVPRSNLVPNVLIDGGCWPVPNHTGGRWLVNYPYPGTYRFDSQFFAEPLPWHVMGTSEAKRAETFQEGSVLPWWVEYRVSAPGKSNDGAIFRVSAIAGTHFLTDACGHPQ